MIEDKLYVYFDDNGTFTDYSNDAYDFAENDFTGAIDSTEDYLYIGFFKPINTFYVEMATASTRDALLSGEYFNGSTFTSLDNQYDSTRAFKKSGFISWNRNQTDEAKTTVNSKEAYWYRFRADTTLDGTIRGINIIFSDDDALKREYFEILDYLPSGKTSFILTHLAVKDQIMGEIKASGSFKYNSAQKKTELTPFDFLNVSQIKTAATFLTLSKIFSNVQDDEADIWRQKSIDYHAMYSAIRKNGFLDIDMDDDGKLDDSERLQRRDVRIVRK